MRRSQFGQLLLHGRPTNDRFMVKHGKHLRTDEVQVVVNEGAAIFMRQKRSMGSCLAGQLAGMNNPKEILKLLNSENDKILSALSKKLNSLADRGTP